MVAAGVLAPASMTVGAVGVGAAVLSLGVAVYSYVVWRSAPDRDGHGSAG